MCCNFPYRTLILDLLGCYLLLNLSLGAHFEFRDINGKEIAVYKDHYVPFDQKRVIYKANLFDTEFEIELKESNTTYIQYILTIIIESAILWFFNGDLYFRCGCAPCDYPLGFLQILFRSSLITDILVMSL